MFKSHASRILILSLFFLYACAYVNGKTLASYDFNGLFGDEESLVAASAADNVSASRLSRGAAYTDGAMAAFTSNGMAVVPGRSTGNSAFLQAGYSMETAVEHDGYWEITLTPAPGFEISIDGITLGSRIASNKIGPRFIGVRTSLDNFHENIVWNVDGGGQGGNVSGTVFLDFGNAVESVSEAVTIRIYGWWRSETSSSFGLWTISNPNASDMDGEGDSPFLVEGTVTAVPVVTSVPIDKLIEGHPDMVRINDSRQKLAVDPYRPIYHFSAPDGMINDPNGLVQWEGLYHLFYQYRPSNSGQWHWGHAVSDNMVHWRDLPIAIAPTKEAHVYSGQTLIEDDRVIAMYHGRKSGNYVAISEDPLLLNWEKLPSNPVIPLKMEDDEGKSIRIFDPTIWKEGDGYYSLSGTYQDGGRGLGRDAEFVQHLFHSPDLENWEYMGPLVEGSRWTDPGEDGAVPIFLPVGQGKHILFFFSHARAAQYMIGSYDPENHRFEPESHGRFNFGPWLRGSLHAAGAFIDERGRLLVMFNLRENMTSMAIPEHGIKAGEWMGIMSLPRELWLDENQELRMRPISELNSLRNDHFQVNNLTIPANTTIPVEGLRGKAMEIKATFKPGEAREFGLEVFRSKDGKEKTVISIFHDVNPPNWHFLSVDVSDSSTRGDVGPRPPEVAPFKLDPKVPVKLHVYIDQSVVEVFVNDVQAVSIRAYPESVDSDGIAVFSKGSDVSLERLDAWEMGSIYP